MPPPALTNDNAALSGREMDVLDLAVSGAKHTDVAFRLNITTNTVKTHLRHVYRKLGATTKKELIEKISIYRYPCRLRPVDAPVTRTD